MIQTGGGKFDPDEPFVFFMAASASVFQMVEVGRYEHLLVPIGKTGEQRQLESLLDGKIFLDSGIFSLAAAHARKHGMLVNEAFTLAPDQVDGFDALLSRYIDLARKLGPRLWGYVELDLGGADNKRRMRRYLEDQGLRPIPVYHPLADGWDYLDELLDEYDRVCISNLARSSQEARKQILLMVWERVRRHHNKPWIHLLGLSASQILLSLPFNSCDSASLAYSLQYGSDMQMGRAMMGNFSQLGDKGYSYDQSVPSDEERGTPKAGKIVSLLALSELRCWRRIWDDLETAIGPMPLYPEPFPLELDVRRATTGLGPLVR